MAAKIQAVPEMLAVLEELQCRGVGDSPLFSYCPLCHNSVDNPAQTRGVMTTSDGHADDCRLAAVIAKAKGG